jgi:uncharacterized protein
MPNDPPGNANDNASTAPAERRRLDVWFKRAPWLSFSLPFAVFMLIGSLEPRPDPAEGSSCRFQIAYQYYPAVYTLKILVTTATIVLVLPGYRKFPFRVTLWGLIIGLAGIVVWVGTCSLHLEQTCLAWVHLDWLFTVGGRSAYDPFRELASAPRFWTPIFLTVRFFGLIAVVPIVEEFFLRGLVMPLCVDHDWQQVPFGTMNCPAVLGAVLYGMLTHPSELLAAAIWFAIVTWLMRKTKSIWDCVLAHAVTNAMLGIYVVCTGKWELM